MSVEEDTTRRVQEARDKHFRPLLAAFVLAKMEAHFGPNWRQHASASHERLDLQALLKTMRDRWIDVFSDAFERGDREKAKDFMYATLKARNDLAHLEADLSDRDGLRYLDAMHELAGYMKGEPAQIAALKRLYDEQRVSGLRPAQTKQGPAPRRRYRPNRSGRRHLRSFKTFLLSNYEKEGTGGPLAPNSAASYCSYINSIEKVLNIDLDHDELTDSVVNSIIDRLKASRESHGVPTKYIRDWSSGLRAYAVYRTTAPAR